MKYKLPFLAITLVVFLLTACFEKTNTNTPKFVEITDHQCKITEDSIHCELILAELPNKLTFNNDRLIKDHLEYNWGISFDYNQDGKYDLALYLSNWKHKNNTKTQSQIINHTQKTVWKLGQEGAKSIGNFDVTIEGNKISFEVQKMGSDLHKIKSNSNIKYETYYNNGNQIFSDSVVVINQF